MCVYRSTAWSTAAIFVTETSYYYIYLQKYNVVNDRHLCYRNIVLLIFLQNYNMVNDRHLCSLNWNIALLHIFTEVQVYNMVDYRHLCCRNIVLVIFLQKYNVVNDRHLCSPNCNIVLASAYSLTRNRCGRALNKIPSYR